MTTVTRTYLTMDSPDQLRGCDAPAGDVRLTRADPCPVALYRTLYTLVGQEYRWLDRNAWEDQALAEYLARAGVAVWVLRAGEELGGYFELVRHPDESVEIAYFGLAPRMIGRGLGKWFLTRAVEEAWRLSPTRVWLHTCTLDHPAAFANYVARGFTPFKTETYELTT